MAQLAIVDHGVNGMMCYAVSHLVQGRCRAEGVAGVQAALVLRVNFTFFWSVKIFLLHVLLILMLTFDLTCIPIKKIVFTICEIHFTRLLQEQTSHTRRAACIVLLCSVEERLAWRSKYTAAPSLASWVDQTNSLVGKSTHTHTAHFYWVKFS